MNVRETLEGERRNYGKREKRNMEYWYGTHMTKFCADSEINKLTLF